MEFYMTGKNVKTMSMDGTLITLEKNLFVQEKKNFFFETISFCQFYMKLTGV